MDAAPATPDVIVMPPLVTSYATATGVAELASAALATVCEMLTR